MRKADYTVLAQAIADERRSAQTWLTPEHDAENTACARGRIGAAERIAQSFARCASVDRAAFLKACGISLQPDTN